MPSDSGAISHFKAIAVALLGVIAAALGIYAVGLFGDYFEANPVYTPIQVTNQLGIDVLGALTPIAAALSTLAVYCKTAKAPAKKLAVTFITATVLAFLLSRISPDGVAGYPLMFAFGAGIAATAVNLHPKPFANMRRNLLATLALTLTCVPISMLIVDLAYSPYFAGAVIGGNGLTDGLLLSTLYAPMTVVAVFGALSYVSQMVLLVRKANNPNKASAQIKIGSVATEKATNQPKKQ